MADNGAVQQEWPDQRLKILIPSWTLMITSTMFLAWRVVYGLMKSRRFMSSDYLLIIATVSTYTHHTIRTGVDRSRYSTLLQHATTRSWLMLGSGVTSWIRLLHLT
jgi:hypothetical protein